MTPNTVYGDPYKTPTNTPGSV